MSGHPYRVLDVFTDTPLAGNPLAVFTDAKRLSAQQMQQLARELNLSETTFLAPPEVEDVDGSDATIRIFTPTTELPFAGHPVLGSAFVVAEQTDKHEITLQTGAGRVSIELDRKAGFGEMEQPLPTREEPPPEKRLLEAIGITHSELPIAAYRNGPLHIYVALATEDDVGDLQPDLQILRSLAPCCVSCFALAAANPRRVRTRVFCPGLGVAEDPATGSAAGPLALHLATHELLPLGAQLEIEQGEEIGRPSMIRARVEGSFDRLEAVKVGGNAVEVARGEYRVA